MNTSRPKPNLSLFGLAIIILVAFSIVYYIIIKMQT
jgi:hypothetical protein